MCKKVHYNYIYITHSHAHNNRRWFNYSISCHLKVVYGRHLMTGKKTHKMMSGLKKADKITEHYPFQYVI